MADPFRLGMPAYNAPGERRWGLIGATVEGEITAVIYTRRAGVIRVITAYPAELRERRRYRRPGK